MTQNEALDILKTGANVFLTGEPGSGKTHTINEYINYLRDRDVEVAITASTGIAATHIGGMTIHSWSGIGIKNKLDKYDLDRIASNEYVSKRIRRAKVLVIDEVSMLSSGTLLMVEAVCREVKQNGDAFGGLQVVFVGDFFQLPPVVRKNTEEDSQMSFMENENTSLFACDSDAWERTHPVVCYITEQYRQDDADFLSVLSAIRTNTFCQKHLEKILTRKIEKTNFPKNAPKLFSHNIDVDSVNTKTLSKIEKEVEIFEMSGEGKEVLITILKKGCLSPEKLELKIGAEVMFTKNNQKERFVNGTLGTVVDFASVSKYPIVKTRNGRQIEVEPMEWSVEENGKIRAKITQIPLRLAWAITVHKSQGMSMDSAIMDLSEVFEYGQGYVALSRVRRLSGLYIIGHNEKAFKVHPEILLKDKKFRQESEEAEKVFGKLEKEKLNKMHNDFIVAMGGKINLGAQLPKRTRRDRKEGGTSFEEIRKKFPKAYMPWDSDEDEKLKKLFSKNIPIKDLAKEFGRKRGAISSRLKKFGLID